MEWQAIPGKELESEITLLSQGSCIKGEVTFDCMTRIHGRVEGKVHGLNGSTIVIGETATIHGEVSGDEIIIDGFVHGDVHAKTRVTISESGRLIGNLKAPNVEIKYGAHFEGRAITNQSHGTTRPSSPNLHPNPSRA